jgi:hypothetical protein
MRALQCKNEFKPKVRNILMRERFIWCIIFPHNVELESIADCAPSLVLISSLWVKRTRSSIRCAVTKAIAIIFNMKRVRDRSVPSLWRARLSRRKCAPRRSHDLRFIARPSHMCSKSVHLSLVVKPVSQIIYNWRAYFHLICLVLYFE